MTDRSHTDFLGNELIYMLQKWSELTQNNNSDQTLEINKSMLFKKNLINDYVYF